MSFYADTPRDPPIYAPATFRALAAHIAEVARQPVLGGRAPRPGIDLTPHVDSLAAMIAETAERYDVARDDWEARNINPPHRDLERNIDPDTPEPGHSYTAYDYGPYAGEGLEDWDELWERDYSRDDGNPGSNRQTNTGGKPRLPNPPPVYPLYYVVEALEEWWKGHVGDRHGQRFSPRFGRNDFEAGRPYDLNYSNAPARVLWFIAMRFDPHYTPENLSDLHKQILRWRVERARKGLAPNS